MLGIYQRYGRRFRKAVAISEYYYFSGQPEKAVKETEILITYDNREIKLSACLIYAYANLSLGNIEKTRYALNAVKEMLATASSNKPEMQATLSFISSAAAVLLHLPLPEELPPFDNYLPLLPTGIRMFALYVIAHYLYLKRIPKKSWHSGSNTCYADRRISYILYILAFGCGYGLHEPETKKQSKRAFAFSMGACKTG